MNEIKTSNPRHRAVEFQNTRIRKKITKTFRELHHVLWKNAFGITPEFSRATIELCIKRKSTFSVHLTKTLPPLVPFSSKCLISSQRKSWAQGIKRAQRGMKLSGSLLDIWPRKYPLQNDWVDKAGVMGDTKNKRDVIDYLRFPNTREITIRS